ncbi:hypothetical protein QR680_014144 [Steinernema hermaphroditum]|uniref:Uncharacterized protein n=1 Tax=Steinernema hermaphroditum TaxID=289476 RepID=A0AA39I7U6_9BILA|nr:hypothetical protein QR680_014144 [Steinernema hermaphroditum]
MDGDAINGILYFVVCFLIVLVGLVFFYVVLRKSPHSLRLYRNNLLNIAVWYYLDMFTIGSILQPVIKLHNERVCVKTCGLAALLPTEMIGVFYFLLAEFTTNVFTALWLSFLCRYLQIASGRISSYLSSFYALAFCFFAHFLSTSATSYVMYRFSQQTDRTTIDGRYSFCLQPTTKSPFSLLVALYTCIEALFLAVSMAIFTILTIRILRSKRSNLSAVTYRLHVRLTLNLILLTALPVLFAIVPLLACNILIRARSPHTYTTCSIAAHMPFVDVLLTCILTLAFVTPYRRAIRRMIPVRMSNVISVGVVRSPSKQV